MKVNGSFPKMEITSYRVKLRLIFIMERPNSKRSALKMLLDILTVAILISSYMRKDHSLILREKLLSIRKSSKLI